MPNSKHLTHGISNLVSLITKMKLGISPFTFDFLKAPVGWRVREFYKFSGDDNKSTMEHASMFMAQMGEASTLDFMNV
jgi:hypothetical protein